jgi:hypothetical protein
MASATDKEANRWFQAWPDAAAFAGGLALAWNNGWQTTDLVWSLWLSSLVVGYALIVWTIFGPAVLFGRAAFADSSIKINGAELALGALGGAVYLIGGLLLLAFFTFHFGMFHFVHSAFLGSFFPLEPGARQGMPGLGLYAQVVSRYWIFLPVAFLTERRAFDGVGSLGSAPTNDASVTAAAIAARKSRDTGMSGMMAPYRNVIRMHLLIFFFAFAHFAGLENFYVYAVVYAVYFFPWSLLKKPFAPANP